MRKLTFTALFLLTTISFAQWAKAPLKIPSQRDPNLYRADIDAQKEITQTINEAGKESKRVLLVFGAAWCGDCYALDYGFHQPRVAPLLNDNFKVVHVNVGRFDTNLDLVKKYHVDLEKGIPSLAVLNPKGGVLYATAEFERARVMTEEDLITFLNAWKPPPQK
ncbi:MAG TPA: thioredoxin family protein [Candidatus Angelobacter sp.]|nr:thioredoxin family protein [Candidatus Angelobacter sp.]